MADAECFELDPALRAAVRGVRDIGVITGAGISAESGIRTYRGEGGVYDDPDEGDRTVDALSGHTLRRDPARTWRVVLALARQSASAAPGPGHLALVAMEQWAERFTLLTQNVDGLHGIAGSRNLIEIHGRVGAARCLSCGAGREFDRPTLAALEEPPPCEACGGMLRPGAVLFGEQLPLEPLGRLQADFIDHAPELLIVVGTTALFPYIVEPVRLATARGRVVVEVNPERTSLSALVDWHLPVGAGLGLRALLEALRA
jgi:NAD-dependent deacetylase